MSELLASRPAHVPAHLERNFDLYNIPGADTDVQAAHLEIQRTFPPVFWTPHHGGHWVVTGGEDILEIWRDVKHFSSRHTTIPPLPKEVPPQIPIELDPPIHAHFRRPLAQALVPSMVAKLEDHVRRVAVEAIEHLVPLGGCEFIEDFSKVLPITVFLNLVAIPLDDKDYLLTLAAAAVRGETVESRTRAQQQMRDYLTRWVRDRRETPGDDLLSNLVNIEIGGTKISELEAVSYATLLLFAGLDTVASMMGFIILFLAEHPTERRQLRDRIDDKRFLRDAIEEMMRRHAIVNLARVVTSDMSFQGVEFRSGDHVLPGSVFVNIDEHLNADPLKVNFDRKDPLIRVFGSGTHACPGATLARREMQIFLEEWLVRIPEFRVKPGTKPLLETGVVNTVAKLELSWP